MKQKFCQSCGMPLTEESSVRMPTEVRRMVTNSTIQAASPILITAC